MGHRTHQENRGNTLHKGQHNRASANGKIYARNTLPMQSRKNPDY